MERKLVLLTLLLSSCIQKGSSLPTQQTSQDITFFDTAIYPMGTDKDSSFWPRTTIGFADAIMIDGKIVIGGAINTDNIDDTQTTFLARYNDNSEIDPDFGADGTGFVNLNLNKTVYTTMGGVVSFGKEWLTGLTASPDGKIVIVGIQNWAPEEGYLGRSANDQ